MYLTIILPVKRGVGWDRLENVAVVVARHAQIFCTLIFMRTQICAQFKVLSLYLLLM